MNLNELIDSNKELIYSIVYRFKNHDVDDLFQVGCLGVIKAYKNYNPSYATKFSTYAYPYILGEIYQYINCNRTIRLNNEYVKLKRNILKAEEYLTQKLNRVPNDLEISEFLEIDLIKLNEIKNMLSCESLDYNYETNTLYDIINIENLDKETLIDLKNAFNQLSKEEKELIKKRYYYNMSQSMIANEMCINQVKVSRLEKKTLTKMRSFMN